MVMHAWEGAPGGTSVAAMVAALTEGAPGRTLAATVMLAAPGGAGGARTSQRQETIAVVLAGMMTLTLDDTATTLGVGDTAYLVAGTTFSWRNRGGQAGRAAARDEGGRCRRRPALRGPGGGGAHRRWSVPGVAG